MEQKIVILKLNDKRYLPTLPKAMNADNQRKLESEFKPGTRDCIRGLTPELEVIVLPNILGVQANDVSFAQRAKDFWADLSVQPTVEGIKLNVALTKKMVGEEEIDFPVNPEDYMIYQIALQSSKVAKGTDDADILDNYDFYLVDLQAQEAKERNEFLITENADLAYVKLVSNFKENEDKINWLIEFLRDKTEYINVNGLEEVSKKILLKKLKDAEPKKFHSATEDKDLEWKSLIVRMREFGIITREGNTNFFGEESLGENKETIAWLKKPENSGKLLGMRSRLDEAVLTRKV